MTPERWQRVKELCQVALEREPSDRGAFLAEFCVDDQELRREVEGLIMQATASDGILGAPIWEKLGIAMTHSAAAGSGPSVRWLPETIGRYRVLRMVGEGGMGSVYEAEQDHPRRAVALKVIRPGLTSPELLRRFERESQALGRLQHPGIAQIYEAGTADTGFGPQPYFAMEFILGQTLKEHVTAHQLQTRQRLELVARICDAVQHAHERGLIHRDLKPGNILVDPTGQPKILDFGVARLTDGHAQATQQTDVGQLVGTLAYMSPEQVLGDPLELDTRSDVYALGVILYELLAGRLPYTTSNRLHEAVQAIREEDPRRLSSISRNYRGDIETIVAKTLEKDKAHRPIGKRRLSIAEVRPASQGGGRWSGGGIRSACLWDRGEHVAGASCT
jgi:serine/threonine protein kinase